jgi:hypothetical protein
MTRRAIAFKLSTSHYAKRSCLFARKLRQESQQKARDHLHSYEWHFRRRYNLPPTDPRFLAATQEDMAIDYWAHFYHDHPNQAATEIEDEDFDLEEIKRKAENGEWEDI